MNSLHVINWTEFLLAAALVSATPGANQLLGLRNALGFGLAWAWLGIIGRIAALAVLIALVVVGLATVLAASPTMLTVIKWCGVVYLLYLGVTAIRARPSPTQAQEPTESSRSLARLSRLPREEFVTLMTNPKALLLMTALLPQFTTPDSDNRIQVAALGAAYLAVEAVVGGLYASAGAVLRTNAPTDGTLRRIDRAAGVCFIALAGALAIESL